MDLYLCSPPTVRHPNYVNLSDNAQEYWGLGFCPLVLYSEEPREHNISASGFVSFLR
jgi:hypothetical protein